MTCACCHDGNTTLNAKLINLIKSHKNPVFHSSFQTKCSICIRVIIVLYGWAIDSQRTQRLKFTFWKLLMRPLTSWDKNIFHINLLTISSKRLSVFQNSIYSMVWEGIEKFLYFINVLCDKWLKNNVVKWYNNRNDITARKLIFSVAPQFWI